MRISIQRVASRFLEAISAPPTIKEVLDGLESAIKRKFKSFPSPGGLPPIGHRSYDYGGHTTFALPHGMKISISWKTDAEGFWSVNFTEEDRRKLGWGAESKLGVKLNAHFQMKGSAKTIVTTIMKALTTIVEKMTEWEAAQEAPAPEPEVEQTWSVAWTGYMLADAGEDPDENEGNGGYVMKVETFSSQAQALAHARDNAPAYLVKGTQMWNEPLGQVEEHDRASPTRLIR